MAISVDQTINASGQLLAAGDTITTPAFSTSKPNTLLLALVSSAGDPITISGGGLTWTLVASIAAPSGFAPAQIYRAFSATALSNVTVTCTYTLGNETSGQPVVASVLALTGVDLSSGDGAIAIGATNTSTSTSSAPTTSLTTTRDGSMLFAACSIGYSPRGSVGAPSAGANQTLITELTGGFGNAWTQSYDNQIPASGTTVTLNATPAGNTSNQIAAVEILAGDSRIKPTITWPTPIAITYGTALSSTQLNATANVPGTFAYSPAAGAVPAVGTDTLTAAFTPADAATYAPVTTTVSLTVNPQLGANKYYRSITIDHTKVSAAQTNFPVMFAGTFPEFRSVANGGHITSTDAHFPFDLVFWADASFTTKLDFEVPYWDPTSGAIEAYILLPILSSTTDTTFYLTYGNASITTDQSNPVALWTTAGYVGVYHFGYTGTTTLVKNSTGNYNGTTQGGAVVNHTDSFNGVSASLSASVAQYSSVEIPGFFGNPAAITAEMWTKVTSGQEGYYGSSQLDAGGYFSISGPGADGVSATVFYYTDSNGGSYSANDYNGTPLDTWYHLAWSVKAGAQGGYVNGQLVIYGSDIYAMRWSGSSNNQNTYLGVNSSGGSGTSMGGYFDEVRFSAEGRDSTWISAQ